MDVQTIVVVDNAVTVIYEYNSTIIMYLVHLLLAPRSIKGAFQPNPPRLLIPL